MTQAASSYPILDAMWSIFLFFGFIAFFWLLFMVFRDVFRRDDIGGWGKTLWTIFVIIVPIIGSLCYLIGEGRAMSDRDAREAAAVRQRTDAYIRSVASDGQSRAVDEVARGKQLLDSGAISQDEFEALKRRVLVDAGSGAGTGNSTGSSSERR